MSLTIIGRSFIDHTVWIDADGDTFPLHPKVIADMRSEVMRGPVTRQLGHTFDEQDVTLLMQAMTRAPYLSDCPNDGEPAPFELNGGWVCQGCLGAYSDAENEGAESGRAS